MSYEFDDHLHVDVAVDDSIDVDPYTSITLSGDTFLVTAPFALAEDVPTAYNY